MLRILSKDKSVDAGVVRFDFDGLKHLADVCNYAHVVFSESECNLKRIRVDILTLDEVVIQ